MKTIIFFLALFASISTFAQTKADPILSLRSTGIAIDNFLLSDGSGNLVWGDVGDIVSAGAGISISGAGVITNTSPDQVVSITGGGGNVVTGTYPAFTITAPPATPFQTLSTATNTTTLSNSGGSFTIQGAGGVTVSTSGSTYTIDASAATGSFQRRATIAIGTAIAAGGTLSFSGVTIPTDLARIMLTVDGAVMYIHASAPNRDAARASATSFTLNRTVSAGSFIQLFY